MVAKYESSLMHISTGQKYRRPAFGIEFDICCRLRKKCSQFFFFIDYAFVNVNNVIICLKKKVIIKATLLLEMKTKHFAIVIQFD